MLTLFSLCNPATYGKHHWQRAGYLNLLLVLVKYISSTAVVDILKSCIGWKTQFIKIGGHSYFLMAMTLSDHRVPAAPTIPQPWPLPVHQWVRQSTASVGPCVALHHFSWQSTPLCGLRWSLAAFCSPTFHSMYYSLLWLITSVEKVILKSKLN